MVRFWVLTTLGIPLERLVLPAKRARLYAPMVRFAMKPPPLVWHQQANIAGTRRSLEGGLTAGFTVWIVIRAGWSLFAPKTDGSRAPRNLRSICDSLFDAPACRNPRTFQPALNVRIPAEARWLRVRLRHSRQALWLLSMASHGNPQGRNR